MHNMPGKENEAVEDSARPRLLEMQMPESQDLERKKSMESNIPASIGVWRRVFVPKRDDMRRQPARNNIKTKGRCAANEGRDPSDPFFGG